VTEVAPIRCAECGCEPREDENAEDEWRVYSDGAGELLTFCPECAERESGGRGHLGRTLSSCAAGCSPTQHELAVAARRDRVQAVEERNVVAAVAADQIEATVAREDPVVPASGDHEVSTA
jgi:hypothetical protein